MTPPRTLTPTDALALIRTFGDDWDGQGANAPFPKAIERAERIVVEETPRRGTPCRVSASPAGTVGVEWQARGFYLEAEAMGDGTVEWMRCIAGQDAEHWTEA